jgi:ubiquinone/menaquinone biosynthesis C-methylase UbiE
MLTQTQVSLVARYIQEQNTADWKGNILSFPISPMSDSMKANAYYFGHPQWANDYLRVVHRDSYFCERWAAVIGDWQNQVVVDIGCAPGNVYAALRDRLGMPKELIGVDISYGGLKIAQSIGYTPVLADAQNLPFVSEFADIVMVNAALHHSDDMAKVLQEAARIVRPGGLLITDQDLQKTMWHDNAIARFIWRARLPIYRLLKRGGHATAHEQYWCQATEVHHLPGDGVTPEFFHHHLAPLGFDIQLYPHNRTIGAEILKHQMGRAEWNIRLAQRLSGVNPDAVEGALVMMCVARKRSQVE